MCPVYAYHSPFGTSGPSGYGRISVCASDGTVLHVLTIHLPQQPMRILFVKRNQRDLKYQIGMRYYGVLATRDLLVTIGQIRPDGQGG